MPAHAPELDLSVDVAVLASHAVALPLHKALELVPGHVPCDVLAREVAAQHLTEVEALEGFAQFGGVGDSRCRIHFELLKQGF